MFKLRTQTAVVVFDSVIFSNAANTHCCSDNQPIRLTFSGMMTTPGYCLFSNA
jgi:hypothetical protein